MILLLFGFFVVIALVLITIGLTRPTESAQAIIGFFFLFLLGLNLMNGNLEYPIGEETSYTYGDNFTNNIHWDYSAPPVTNLSSQDSWLFHENTTTTYRTIDDTTTQRIGLYLSVGSAVGMIGVFFSLGRNRYGWEGDL